MLTICTHVQHAMSSNLPLPKISALPVPKSGLLEMSDSQNNIRVATGIPPPQVNGLKHKVNGRMIIWNDAKSRRQ
jgi:hypothetical protein